MKYVTFPGTNGHWANTNTAVSNFNADAAESFTIAVWGRITANGTFDVLATTGPDSSAPTGLFLRASDGTQNRPDVTASDADSISAADSSTTLTVGAWTHAVLRLDRADATLKVFLNAVERGSVDASGIGDVPGDTAVGIAAQALGSGNCPCSIVSVEFYVDAASDAEIVAANAGGLGTKLSGPTGTAGIFDAADFDLAESNGATSADAQGNTWTLVGAGTIVEDYSAALTGTAVTGGVLESEIVAGGQTIIITLTGDTWVATAGDDNAITTAIIAGIDSGGSEGTGWDAVVKAHMTHAEIVRTSATVLTITLAAEATYSITGDETITVTIPATALTGARALVAANTFTVTNETPAAGSAANRLLLGVG